MGLGGEAARAVRPALSQGVQSAHPGHSRTWGPSLSRGQPDWGERLPPLPSRPHPLPGWAAYFGSRSGQPVVSQAGWTQEEGSGGWDIGVPLRVKCRCNSSLLRCCPLAGRGLRTLTCAGRVASLFGGTRGLDESDACLTVSPSHVLLHQNWQPLCQGFPTPNLGTGPWTVRNRAAQ